MVYLNVLVSIEWIGERQINESTPNITNTIVLFVMIFDARIAS